MINVSAFLPQSGRCTVNIWLEWGRGRLGREKERRENAHICKVGTPQNYKPHGNGSFVPILNH